MRGSIRFMYLSCWDRFVEITRSGEGEGACKGGEHEEEGDGGREWARGEGERRGKVSSNWERGC